MPGLVVDCADPASIAAWWGRIYQAPVEVSPEGWAAVEQVAGMPVLSMAFNGVPEAKTVKNRVHWDVTVTDLQALLDAGAILLRTKDNEIRWHVLADPEGNEFCRVRRLAGGTRTLTRTRTAPRYRVRLLAQKNPGKVDQLSRVLVERLLC